MDPGSESATYLEVQFQFKIPLASCEVKHTLKGHIDGLGAVSKLGGCPYNK